MGYSVHSGSPSSTVSRVCSAGVDGTIKLVECKSHLTAELVSTTQQYSSVVSLPKLVVLWHLVLVSETNTLSKALICVP